MDRYDLQYDDNGLIIKDNDVIYGVSDTQHIQDTINAAPGWWKENYADGVNIRQFLNSPGQEPILARKIKIELESDLYDVVNPLVNFVNGILVISPNASI